VLWSRGLITGREVVSFVEDAPFALVKTSPIFEQFMNLKGEKDWDVSFKDFIRFFYVTVESPCLCLGLVEATVSA